MTTSKIIITVLTSSAFTGVLIELLRMFQHWLDRRKNKGFAKLEKDIDSIRQRTDETSNKIDWVKGELDRQKETDMVLLHDRIWDIFNRLEHQDYVTVEDKANLEYLYDEYRANNGNHQAEHMYEVIENKPIISKGKEKVITSQVREIQ